MENLAPPPRPIEIPAELGFFPYQSYPSPNQQYTVFMQEVEPGGRPHIFNQATNEITTLFENYSGGSFYGWQPDGTHFVFWIDGVGLMLVNAETFEITVLDYPETPVQGAAISPDGIRIAYVSGNNSITYALWLVSTAGSDAKAFFDVGSGAYMYSNAWSPDNRHLIYPGNCNDQIDKTSLCLYNIKTNNKKELLVSYTGYAPTWSPDGILVASTGLTPGEEICGKTTVPEQDNCLFQAHSIFIENIETGELTMIAQGISPVWSPDGSMLAFLSNRSGSNEIWLIKRDGQGLVQITSDGLHKSPNTLTWISEAKSE